MLRKRGGYVRLRARQKRITSECVYVFERMQ